MVSAALLKKKKKNEASCLTQASQDWSPGDLKSPAAVFILSKYPDHWPCEYVSISLKMTRRTPLTCNICIMLSTSNGSYKD